MKNHKHHFHLRLTSSNIILQHIASIDLTDIMKLEGKVLELKYHLNNYSRRVAEKSSVKMVIPTIKSMPMNSGNTSRNSQNSNNVVPGTITIWSQKKKWDNRLKIEKDPTKPRIGN